MCLKWLEFLDALFRVPCILISKSLLERKCATRFRYSTSSNNHFVWTSLLRDLRVSLNNYICVILKTEKSTVQHQHYNIRPASWSKRVSKHSQKQNWHQRSMLCCANTGGKCPEEPYLFPTTVKICSTQRSQECKDLQTQLGAAPVATLGVVPENKDHLSQLQQV